MSELRYTNMAYCSICDQYFPGEEAKAQHVQLSPNHPRCDTCDRRFANKNALRNHLVCSTRHHYCVVCERDFRTAAGLTVHMEYASVHRDDSDDDDSYESDDEDESVGNTSDGWEDALGAVAFPDQAHTSSFGIEHEHHEYASERASDDESLPVPSEDEGEESWDELQELGDSGDEDDSVDEGPEDGDHLAQEHTTSPSLSQDVSVPTRPLSMQSSRSQSFGTFTCPLCLEPPKTSSATRCGHVFCTRCIHTALEGKKQCPVCRMPALEKHLRTIYLGGVF